jgi:hypothetical protein
MAALSVSGRDVVAWGRPPRNHLRVWINKNLTGGPGQRVAEDVPHDVVGFDGVVGGQSQLAAFVEDDQPVVSGEVVHPYTAGKCAGESSRDLVHRVDG